MKKIIQIIIIAILFISSVLIFWAGLSPKTFPKIFVQFPISNSQNNLRETSGDQIEEPPEIISSEPVLATVGQLTVDNTVWNVEVVDNDTDRVSGLSNRKNLYRQSGMLFVFDKMAPQSFWMKDMLIPIDMIFFDNNWKIVLIESNLQPSTFPETFGGDIESQYVLEVNALEANVYGLKVGDQAIFLNK